MGLWLDCVLDHHPKASTADGKAFWDPLGLRGAEDAGLRSHRRKDGLSQSSSGGLTMLFLKDDVCRAMRRFRKIGM